MAARTPSGGTSTATRVTIRLETLVRGRTVAMGGPGAAASVTWWCPPSGGRVGRGSARAPPHPCTRLGRIRMRCPRSPHIEHGREGGGHRHRHRRAGGGPCARAGPRGGGLRARRPGRRTRPHRDRPAHGRRGSGSTPASWCTTSTTIRGCRGSSGSWAWRCRTRACRSRWSAPPRAGVLGRAPVAAATRPGAPRLRRPAARHRAVPAHGQAALEERHARSTLDDFVRSEGYSRSFRDHYLVPFASALWSTAPDADPLLAGVLRGPLLPEPRPAGLPPPHLAHGRRRQPPLRRRDHRAAGERLRLGAEVRAVTRDADGVEVRTADDAPTASTRSSSPRTRPRRSRC